ncbi:MAG: hypothetical protein Q3960_04870 [Lactobacillus sp.]|nr:hypothetical protein [Lactobacillus sp.]
MRSTLYQMKITFKRVLVRNPAFFLFDLGFPVMFYALFTKAINTGVPESFKVLYLIT